MLKLKSVVVLLLSIKVGMAHVHHHHHKRGHKEDSNDKPESRELHNFGLFDESGNDIFEQMAFDSNKRFLRNNGPRKLILEETMTMKIGDLEIEEKLHKAEGVFSSTAKLLLASKESPEKIPTVATYENEDASMVLTFLPGGEMDGLILKEGTSLHLHKGKGESVVILEKEEVGQLCGNTSPKPSSGSSNSKHRELGELNQWVQCYEGQEQRHTISIGFAMDRHMYAQVGNSIDGAVSYISSLISEVNLVYKAQFNFELVVADVYIADASDKNVGWNTEGKCDLSTGDLLTKFRLWQDRPSNQGLWYLLSDCVDTHVVGKAYIGSLCNERSNFAVSHHRSNDWRIAAHEIGHIFGAWHTFEEGMGNTGGIMDYGNGMLTEGKHKGEYGFNEKYRRSEICNTLSRVIPQCEFIKVKTLVPSVATLKPTSSPTSSPTFAPTISPTFIPTASPTEEAVISGICNAVKKKSCLKDANCGWDKKKSLCKPLAQKKKKDDGKKTTLACNEIQNKKNCKVNGCKWNKKKKCFGKNK